MLVSDDGLLSDACGGGFGRNSANAVCACGGAALSTDQVADLNGAGHVADAVSRDARARCEGWTRVQTPSCTSLPSLSTTSVDEAALDLLLCPVQPPSLPCRRVVGLGAPGGAETRAQRRL